MAISNPGPEVTIVSSNDRLVGGIQQRGCKSNASWMSKWYEEIEIVEKSSKVI